MKREDTRVFSCVLAHKNPRSTIDIAGFSPHVPVAMTLISQILAVADVFCSARRLSKARVSTLVFNDGKRLARLAEGRDLNTGSYESAMAWFSSNWPSGTEWPAMVPRPAVRLEMVRPWSSAAKSSEAA